MDFVKCELCGRDFKNNYGLTRHLVSKHPEITTREYFEKYIPVKLCKCGCGQFTHLKQGSERANYILGHSLVAYNISRIGKPRSEEVKNKISLSSKGKKLSLEARKKISVAQSNMWTEKKRKEAGERVAGEKHPNWKGGRPDREGMYRGNSKEQVQTCRERDNNTCQMCGATKEDNRNRNMAVHHITPYYDSYDNSLENLICLCEKCHPVADRGDLSKENIINYYKEMK